MVAGCIRQLIIVYSNDFIGICLAKLSTGRLRREWSYYGGGRLSRFDCTLFCFVQDKETFYTYIKIPEYVCELIFFINFTDKLKERQHLCTSNLNFFVW